MSKWTSPVGRRERSPAELPLPNYTTACPDCGFADELEGFDALGMDNNGPNLFCPKCHAEFLPVLVEVVEPEPELEVRQKELFV